VAISQPEEKNGSYFSLLTLVVVVCNRDDDIRVQRVTCFVDNNIAPGAIVRFAGRAVLFLRLGLCQPMRARRVRSNDVYDPRGHTIRTLNPDGSEQRMIYGVPGTSAAPDLSNPDLFEPTPASLYLMS